MMATHHLSAAIPYSRSWHTPTCIKTKDLPCLNILSFDLYRTGEGQWAEGPFSGFFVDSQWVLRYIMVDASML